MATQSSSLACRVPWTEKPGRLHSMGSQKSWTQLSDKLFHFHFYLIVDKSLVQKYSWSLNPLIQTTLGKEKFFLFFFCPTTWDAGSSFPNQGSSPCFLQWKCRVLTMGLPRKSEELPFWLRIWNTHLGIYYLAPSLLLSRDIPEECTSLLLTLWLLQE